MKALIEILALFAGVNAYAGAACDQYVGATEKLVKATEDRFGLGEVTRTDVASAQVGAARAKFTCRLITKSDYCALAIPALNTHLAGVTEEAKVGQRTTDDIVRSQIAAFEARLACE